MKKIQSIKKTKNIKLELNRETLRTLQDNLRVLQDHELREVHGGYAETGPSAAEVCCA